MSWEIALTVGAVATAIGLFFAGSSMDDEHAPLKLFFLVMGIFILISGAVFNYQIIEANNATINNSVVQESLTVTNSTVHKGLWVTGYVTLLYFLIYIIMLWLNAAGKIITKWPGKRQP